MINRVNTYTGVPYKERESNPWLGTGNELEVLYFEWDKRDCCVYKKSGIKIIC